ncbi:MAG: class I SAM-dependent methyltransferase [Pseudomonadota bacterium]
MSKAMILTVARPVWHALPSPVKLRLKPLARRALGVRTPAAATGAPIATDGGSVAAYWTDHNVTLHQRFASRQESLDYFHWRCDQYPGYLDLMPVSGQDGKDILDFGCGPGNDLVGFAEYSKPRSITGCDVSTASVAEAKRRMELHATTPCNVIVLDAQATTLPFADAQFDYIHSSGVLHHVVDLPATMAELRRILKPGGTMRVMVYHTDSIWMHLYVAHILRLRDATIPKTLPIKQAFTRSTDGPQCPIANCYTYEEFAAIAQQAGLGASFRGVACSLFERKLVQQSLNDAAMDLRLEAPHRQFLLELTFDAQLNPIYRGKKAGIDLVIELTRPL